MGEPGAVVLDCGTYCVKAGFAGEDQPHSRVPCVVGRVKSEGVMVGTKQLYVGGEAKAGRGKLDLRYPVTRGHVTNWEDMTKIYEHVYFSVLNVPPEDNPVLVTEPSLNTKASREKLTQLFFEDFKVPAFYVAKQPVLALYASGRTTGIVLDMGEGVTCTAPIYEGYALNHAICSTETSGGDITEYLKALLVRSRSIDEGCEIELVREIKEKVCHVALNFEEEMKAPGEKTFQLPDGKTIAIGNESFRAAELLFNSSLAGKSCPGLQTLLVDSVQKCDVDIQKSLYDSVVVCGGTSLLPGLAERLTQETKPLVAANMLVRTIAPPEREYSTWIGGSILASLTCYKGMWIQNIEYEESGPNIVHRKCF